MTLTENRVFGIAKGMCVRSYSEREKWVEEKKVSSFTTIDWRGVNYVTPKCSILFTSVKGPSGKTIDCRLYIPMSYFFLLLPRVIYRDSYDDWWRREDFRCRRQRSLWQSLHRSMAHLLARSGTPRGPAYSCRSGTVRKQALARETRTHPSFPWPRQGDSGWNLFYVFIICFYLRFSAFHAI